MEFTKDDWQKVRHIYKRWVHAFVWVIPSQIYFVFVAIGLIIIFLDTPLNYLSTLSIIKKLLLACGLLSLLKLYGRQEHESGYIDGFKEAKDFFEDHQSTC